MTSVRDNLLNTYHCCLSDVRQAGILAFAGMQSFFACHICHHQHHQLTMRGGYRWKMVST